MKKKVFRERYNSEIEKELDRVMVRLYEDFNERMEKEIEKGKEMLSEAFEGKPAEGIVKIIRPTISVEEKPKRRGRPRKNGGKESVK